MMNDQQTFYSNLHAERTMDSVCRDLSILKQDFHTWQQIVDLIAKTTNTKLEAFDHTLRLSNEKINKKIEEHHLQHSIVLDEQQIELISLKKLIDELQERFYPTQQQTAKIDGFAVGLMQKIEEYKVKIEQMTYDQELMMQKLQMKKDQGNHIFLDQMQGIVDEFYKKLNSSNEKKDQQIMEVHKYCDQITLKLQLQQNVVDNIIKDNEKQLRQTQGEIQTLLLRSNSFNIQQENLAGEIFNLKLSVQNQLTIFENFSNKMNEMKQQIEMSMKEKINDIEGLLQQLKKASCEFKDDLQNYIDKQIIEIQLKREKIVENDDNLAKWIKQRHSNQQELKKRIKSLPQDNYSPQIDPQVSQLRLLHNNQVIKIKKSCQGQRPFRSSSKNIENLNFSKSFYQN